MRRLVALPLAGTAVALGLCVLALGAGAVQTGRLAAGAERAVPPAGRFLDVGGSRLHYLERGRGPAVLLLHGLGGSLLQMTDPLFPRLDGFRLVAVDRPGSGYSERRQGDDAGIRAQAAAVSGLIERLALGRVLVVGHSLGGTVALQLALDHPDQVAGLALLAPLTYPTEMLLGESKYLFIRPDALRRLAAYTVAVPYARHAYRRGVSQSFGPQEAPPDYDTAGGGKLVLRPEALLNASRDAVALADEPDLAAMQPRFKELRMPVGVLFGDRDQLLSADRETARLREALPRLEARTLEGVGHMIQFAEPARTAGFIREMARQAFAQ